MSIDVLPCSSANFVEFSTNGSGGISSCAQVSSRGRSSRSMNTNRRYPAKSYDASYVKNTVALAVIARLHAWCCRLFWLTIICVMGCCGELNTNNKQKTLQDVRRSIATHKRSKALSELEMQVRNLSRQTYSPSTILFPPHLRSIIICFEPL